MAKLNHINFKKILIILLWVIVLSGIGTLVAFAIKKKNETTCKGIGITITSIQERSFLEPKEIDSCINTTNGKKLEGQLIREVDLQKLTDALKKNPWLADSKLYFDSKDVLRVEVAEKTPQARVFDENGNSYYLDETCGLLPYRSINNLQLPVFTNYNSTWKPQSSAAKTIRASIKLISNEIMKDPFLMAMIDQVDIDQQGDFILIPKIGEQQIIFGDSANCYNKFQKLKLFYKKVIPLKGWDKYSKVSLQFKSQIVATVRDMPEPTMDSMKTLRIINSYANKSSLLSSEVMQHISNEADAPADQTMILQSMERDMPVDENTSIDMRSVNQETILKRRNANTNTSQTATPIKKQTVTPKKKQSKNDF